jgi:hypothetical protein
MLRLLMQPSFWTLPIGDRWARGNSNASTRGVQILILLLHFLALPILFLSSILLLLLLALCRMCPTPDVE